MPHVLFRSGEQTAHTRLLLPGPSMYDFLYSLALEAGEGFTWKGRPQTRGAIEEVCWADTFDHAVILQEGKRRTDWVHRPHKMELPPWHRLHLCVHSP
jgi:hypothetical protein